MGFLARVVCVGEGPLDVILSTSPSLNATLVLFCLLSVGERRGSERERLREGKGREEEEVF